MPRTVERHYSLAGGLNDDENPVTLAPDELSRAYNIRYTPNGGVIRRKGQEALTPDPIDDGPVTFQHRFYKNDGSKYHMAFSNQTMYDIDESTGTPLQISDTEFTENSHFGAATFQDYTYFGNGIEPGERFDGSDSVLVSGSPPEFRYIVNSTTAQRLFAVETNSSVLHFSALQDGDDWTAENDAGAIGIGTNDGENITGMVEFLGKLVIFKPSSIHELSGSDPQTFRLLTMNPEIGCIAPDSIAVAETGIYFLSHQGWYRYDGARAYKVSKNVNFTLGNLTKTALPQAVGWVSDELYECGVPSEAGENDLIFTYAYNMTNTRGRGAWNIDQGRKAASVCKYSGEENQIFLGGYDGRIYLQDTGTIDERDDGDGELEQVSIDWNATTMDHFFGEPERRKKTKRIHLLAHPSGNYDMNVRVAYNGSQMIELGTVSLDTGAAALDDPDFGLDDPDTALDGAEDHKKFSVSAIGNCYSMKIEFSGSNDTKLFGYSVVLRKKYIK